MKSNHQCGLCGRLLEMEWSYAPPGDRGLLQMEMDMGHCFVGRCRVPGERKMRIYR